MFELLGSNSSTILTTSCYLLTLDTESLAPYMTSVIASLDIRGSQYSRPAVCEAAFCIFEVDTQLKGAWGQKLKLGDCVRKSL